MQIESFGSLKTALGECPVWYDGQLWLMDCRAGFIFALDGDSGELRKQLAVPAPAGSFAFNADGQIIVALKEEIALLNPQNGRLRKLAHIGTSHPSIRLNDGIALMDGSFVVGTMHAPREVGEAPLGGLFRLSTDLRLTQIEQGMGVTNGPSVNPVNGRFHLADSTERVIYSYAMSLNGTLSDKQVIVRTDAQASGPDGCCFDDQGGLWTALVRAGALARYDRNGSLTHRVDLPTAHPTALCFGGTGMDTIYVTSISDSGRLSASGPLDGRVLRVGGSGYRGQARPLCRFDL